jgi:carbon storage regulator CsrA
MLSIERRCGESISIGDDIQVEVLALGRAFVKLAIRAPRRVPILRGEVADRGPNVAPMGEAAASPMLIVRRRVGESVRVGSDVNIVISHLRCGRATLAVWAGGQLRIRRGESRIVRIPQARLRPPDEAIVQANFSAPRGAGLEGTPGS